MPSGKGGSALPLLRSLGHSSISEQFKHYCPSPDQTLQPPWRRAAESCQGSWVQQRPVWSHDFDFLFLLLPCAPDSFCDNVVISALPACPLLGLEQGEAEEIFSGPWITMGRTAHGGQKKRSLQGAKRLVLGREGVRKMLAPKLVHKNPVKIPQNCFLIFLYMQRIVWDLRPGHGKFLFPMSFIYTGCNLKSWKKSASLSQIPPVPLRSPQQSRTAWNKGGIPTRKIQ